MLIRRHNAARAFTLVEMLVVIAIIGVLVGLLLPAVVGAVNSARRAQMALEISQLEQALNAYKNKFGDFPPSLRGQTGYNNFIRHVRKCYPKIDSGHLSLVTAAIWTKKDDMMDPEYDTVRLDEAEALTFWLSGVDNDPRYPFKAILGTSPTSRIALYDFDEQRLVRKGADDADNDGTVKTGPSTTAAVDYPSYRAKYAKDTCYIHVDARSYAYYFSCAESYRPQAEGGNLGATRPYFQDGGSSYPNSTTFQIICAGQDGEFGADVYSGMTRVAKQFPSGANYTEDDKDNITNFSDGRRLSDSIP